MASILQVFESSYIREIDLLAAMSKAEKAIKDDLTGGVPGKKWVEFNKALDKHKEDWLRNAVAPDGFSDKLGYENTPKQYAQVCAAALGRSFDDVGVRPIPDRFRINAEAEHSFRSLLRAESRATRSNESGDVIEHLNPLYVIVHTNNDHKTRDEYGVNYYNGNNGEVNKIISYVKNKDGKFHIAKTTKGKIDGWADHKAREVDSVLLVLREWTDRVIILDDGLPESIEQAKQLMDYLIKYEYEVEAPTLGLDDDEREQFFQVEAEVDEESGDHYLWASEDRYTEDEDLGTMIRTPFVKDDYEEDEGEESYYNDEDENGDPLPRTPPFLSDLERSSVRTFARLFADNKPFIDAEVLKQKKGDAFFSAVFYENLKGFHDATSGISAALNLLGVYEGYRTLDRKGPPKFLEEIDLFIDGLANAGWISDSVCVEDTSKDPLLRNRLSDGEQLVVRFSDGSRQEITPRGLEAAQLLEGYIRAKLADRGLTPTKPCKIPMSPGDLASCRDNKKTKILPHCADRLFPQRKYLTTTGTPPYEPQDKIEARTPKGGKLLVVVGAVGRKAKPSQAQSAYNDPDTNARISEAQRSGLAWGVADSAHGWRSPGAQIIPGEEETNKDELPSKVAQDIYRAALASKALEVEILGKADAFTNSIIKALTSRKLRVQLSPLKGTASAPVATVSPSMPAEMPTEVPAEREGKRDRLVRVITRLYYDMYDGDIRFENARKSAEKFVDEVIIRRLGRLSFSDIIESKDRNPKSRAIFKLISGVGLPDTIKATKALLDDTGGILFDIDKFLSKYDTKASVVEFVPAMRQGRSVLAWKPTVSESFTLDGSTLLLYHLDDEMRTYEVQASGIEDAKKKASDAIKQVSLNGAPSNWTQTSGSLHPSIAGTGRELRIGSDVLDLSREEAFIKIKFAIINFDPRPRDLIFVESPIANEGHIKIEILDGGVQRPLNNRYGYRFPGATYASILSVNSISLDIVTYYKNAKRKQVDDEIRDAESKAKTAREDIDGYLDHLPMKAGKARAALQKSLRIRNPNTGIMEIMGLRDFVRASEAVGSRVYTSQGGELRLEMLDGGFYTTKDLTKTAFDYFIYLREKRNNDPNLSPSRHKAAQIFNLVVQQVIAQGVFDADMLREIADEIREEMVEAIARKIDEIKARRKQGANP
jgi:hypothetical protein